MVVPLLGRRNRGLEPRPHSVKYSMDDIKKAKGLLKLQASSLFYLADSLGDDFTKAVKKLQNVKGKIVVSGVGKSGHVGKKMAATFASTGTRSIFVHPSEAAHGDLGMVGKKDVVIAISKSGESMELAGIVVYCKRHKIPIIGITAVDGSSLAKNANIKLILPSIRENDRYDMVPTTSTTMTMALGDALAMVLMDRNKFTDVDFKDIHPGGKLGQSLLTVKQLMHKGDALPLVGPEALMGDTMVLMTQKCLGCAGVINVDGELIGIITDGDLRRNVGMHLWGMDAKDVMCRTPKTISSNMFAKDALRIMNEKKITNLFVLRGKKPVGLIHIHDCLRAGIS